VLANVFLHYAFDSFLVREFPTVEFERYCDDAVVHCVTERQARTVWAALSERMEHPPAWVANWCRTASANRRLVQ
jgi:RNA-directed DNA polymerase